MTVTLGILALLETQPGKGSELAEFLKEARELAIAEEGTVSWYAVAEMAASPARTRCLAAADAHINGQIPAALAKVAVDLLASDPDIRPVDVLAFK